MKTLNTYINEWQVSNKTVSSIKKTPYFIYKISSKSTIRIFDDEFEELEDFKNKVYINGKQVEIKTDGCTVEKYEPGEYKVYIEDIDDITDCTCMFQFCTELIDVPIFDTSKVEKMRNMFCKCDKLENVPVFNTSKVIDMYGMFMNCKNIEKIPLFDTRNVHNMTNMFYGCEKLENVPLFNMNSVYFIKSMFNCCNKLDDQTKTKWSKIYDFENNIKIK